MNRKLGLLFTIVMVASLVLGACAQPTPATVIQTVEVVTTVEVPVVETVEVEKTVVSTVEVPMEVNKEATLAIEHFSVIEGTTWSGAQDRAGKRIAEKYPNVKYVYRENVAPINPFPLQKS